MSAFKKARFGRVLVNIVLSGICILFFIPLYFFLNNAFKINGYIHTDPFILTPSTFTLYNVTEAFKLMEYPKSFLNSTAILVISAALLVVCGSLAAYAIVIIGGRWMERLYVFIVALITLPIQVAMIPLVNELYVLGLINSYFGTSFAYVAFGLPFTIFIYVGYMRSLPKELGEAATVDGCGAFATYLRIYMPLMKTVTGTVLILRGLYMWNDILMPMITISTSRMSTLPQKLVSFATSYISMWDLMFGAALLTSIPIMILFLFFQRTFIQGIVDGSVKG